MTRETKIGLLVGLTFIIVLGVLLSDYLVTATNPQPAPLADAASDALNALRTPQGPSAAMAQTPPPENVAPVRQIPTVADMSEQNKLPGMNRVEVKGPGAVAP